MTKSASRRISANEWIQDHFSPVVGVLASADAETVCSKNNLSMVEMLQPFARVNEHLTVKDPEGVIHNVPTLNINFQDFRRDPSRLFTSKLISDSISHVGINEPMIQRTFGGGSLRGRQQTLEAPGFTPWFDVWSKFTLCSVPTGTADHEFLRHHLGCIFVVSSSLKNPVEQLQGLSQQQHRHQHEKGSVNSNGGGGIYPQYLSPNILKYYVVIHDVLEVDNVAAQEMFTKVQSAFGSSACHLLSINSRTGQLTQSNAETDKTSNTNSNEMKFGNPAVADYWINHSINHRFSNVETRLASIIGELPNNSKSSTVKTKLSNYNNATPKESKSEEDCRNNHPLANTTMVTDTEHFMDDTESPQSGIQGIGSNNSSTVLVPVTPTNVALLLNSNDVDRIRALIKEFVIKGLIPYMEKQMRTLHEIVTNRKSRSLFSGAKKWFSGAAASAGSRAGGAGSLLGGAAGSSSIGVSSGGTSVVYGREAPEIQMRRLGDIYFMLKLYKLAYNCYHTAKRDFQSDEAWNYYAGAAEMSAISQFMQGSTSTMVLDNTKLSSTVGGTAISSVTPTKYPAHYMEDAITKYLSVCQMPEFALRATLFDALCFKQQGMFQEAALSFIRMTTESKDLRSALLLEQAAYCYLLGSAPLIRKYAFHIILSGYRFAKSGQKFHSSRAYRQGFQIYKGHGWSLSEDHILYSLGHQSLLLKDHYTAANLFNELLSNTSSRAGFGTKKATPYMFGGGGRFQSNTNPLQQMCHLREFFIVHHMREKEDKKVVPITIPTFIPQESILDMTGRTAEKDARSNPSNISSYNLTLPSYETLMKVCGDTSSESKSLPRFELERVIAERISGQEIFMTQTCQAVFGPHSDNTLPPQAVVGEHIRIILPSRNLFQTPLLLKKVYLLWKFCPLEADASTVSPNNTEQTNEGDNADCTSVHSEKISWVEAEALVKTDVVESVLLSTDATALIDLGVTPKQPGSLTIVGIQYSIKAQFPQSESTDYTVQGRQYLKVQGPRLMSTKDHRINKDPLYNKDVRFGQSLEIFPADSQALANLGFELSGWPEGIHQGEVKKIDLVITNLRAMDQASGVNRIYLVHHYPGLFATEEKLSQRGRKKSEAQSSHASEGLPFSFPVIVDPSLTFTKQDGNSEEVPIDILPIDIEGDLMDHHRQAKRSITVPIWICGPSQLGRHNFTVHFYYEPSKKIKMSSRNGRPLAYRMLRVDLTTIVHPSLSLTAVRSPACMHENDLSQAILVNVINATGGSPSMSLETIRIIQISLISGRNYVICELLSGNDEYSPITKGQSRVFCLKSAYNDSGPPNVDQKVSNKVTTDKVPNLKPSQFCISQIRVSDSGSGCNEDEKILVSSLSNSPCINFVKSGFTFTEPPKASNQADSCELNKDLLVVSWQGAIGESKVNGQLFVPILEDYRKDNVDSAEDTFDSGTSYKSSNSGQNLGGQTTYDPNASDSEGGDTFSILATPKTPCNISVQVDENIKHDFDQTPMAIVPFTVTIENPSSFPASFYYKADSVNFHQPLPGNINANQGSGINAHTTEGCRVLGCTNAILHMKSSVRLVLPFQVIVTKPGIYHFNCLRFQMGRVLTKENTEHLRQTISHITSPPPFDEDELIPLQLSFVVIHVPNTKA